MEEDIRHIYVIIEELNGKFDFMLELMRMMNNRMETFATKEYVNSLIQKQEIANMAIKFTNVVNDHEMRIGTLESLSRQTLTKSQ